MVYPFARQAVSCGTFIFNSYYNLNLTYVCLSVTSSAVYGLIGTKLGVRKLLPGFLTDRQQTSFRNIAFLLERMVVTLSIWPGEGQGGNPIVKVVATVSISVRCYRYADNRYW